MNKVMFFLASLVFLSAVQAQEYEPDKQFGKDGYWLSNAPSDDRGYEIAIQPDGKIVTVGRTSELLNLTDAKCLITRLNANGTPDTGFGNGGSVTFHFDDKPSTAYAVALQADGKILVLAFIDSGGIGVARLMPNGNLDNSFHGNGMHTLSVPPVYFGGDETPMALTLQPDGKIVAAFASSPATFTTAVNTVVRLLENGDLDPSFSGDGIAYIDSNESAGEFVSGVQVFGGLIYVCGYSNFSSSLKFTLCCFNTDGSPNTGFDGDGSALGPEGVCSDMRIQADGKPVLAGYSNAGTRQIRVERFLPTGATDPDFLGVGFGYAPIKINGMALLPNGNIVLAGVHSSFSPFSFFVIVYNKEGIPVQGFSSNGFYFQDKFNGIDEELHNVAVDNKGNIIAVGYYENDSTGEDQVVLRLTDKQVRLITGNGAGAQGDTIRIPVRLEGCDNLYAIQGQVSVTTPGTAQVVGFEAKNANISFNGNLFNFFNANGTSLSANDTLFFVKIVLTGNPGDSTQITITPPPGSVIEVACGLVNLTPHTLVAGQVKILSNLKISGIILDRLGKPVGQANVTLTGSDKGGKAFSFSAVTGADGTYLFDKVPICGKAVVKPAKNINPKNGITAFDMLIGQRWLLKMNPPEFGSSLQVVAGDANNNKLFSSQDLLFMQALSLGNLITFPNQTSWVFVQSGYVFKTPFTVSNVFPYPSDSTLVNLQKDATVNFTGIKVGDIVTSADPQNRPSGDNDSPILLVGMTQQQDGEVLTITLNAEQFKQIGSAQWGLQFDPNTLTFLSADMPGWALGEKAVAQGLLKFSWFSADGKPKTLASGTQLATLRFRVEKPSLALNEPLVQLSEQALESEAMVVYDNLLVNRIPIALRLNASLSATKSINAIQGYELEQNTPNPASGLVQIPFELGKAGDATVELFDQNGQQLRFVYGHFQQGRQQVEMDVRGLTAGVYYYKLSAGRFVAVKQMIVLP